MNEEFVNTMLNNYRAVINDQMEKLIVLKSQLDVTSQRLAEATSELGKLKTETASAKMAKPEVSKK